MSSLRAQAELGVTSSGTYLAALCTTSGATTGGLATLLAAATATAGNTAVCGSNTGVTAWGAAIILPTGGYYCADSTGYSGVSTVTPATEIETGAASTDTTCNNA
jgi:hypothetical protein